MRRRRMRTRRTRRTRRMRRTRMRRRRMRRTRRRIGAVSHAVLCERLLSIHERKLKRSC
jgi:hypothetical protein